MIDAAHYRGYRLVERDGRVQAFWGKTRTNPKFGGTQMADVLRQIDEHLERQEQWFKKHVIVDGGTPKQNDLLLQALKKSVR